MSVLPYAIILAAFAVHLGLSYYACVVLDPRRTVAYWAINAASIVIPLCMIQMASHVAYANARAALPSHQGAGE